jgi:NAD-dependent aldehyde dehydrogenases
MAKTLGTLRHYIDGGWVPSRSEEVRPVYDPGSGEEMAVVPFTTREETDAAVEAASAGLYATNSVANKCTDPHTSWPAGPSSSQNPSVSYPGGGLSVLSHDGTSDNP